MGAVDVVGVGVVKSDNRNKQMMNGMMGNRWKQDQNLATVYVFLTFLKFNYFANKVNE